MNNKTIFKTALLPVAFLITSLFFAACSNPPEAPDTHFMIAAAEINLSEIKLGQLAQHKGSIPEVRALGKMMETLHTKELSDLTSLATHKGITVPLAATNDVEDAYQKLNSKAGNEFDKEYCTRMVTVHKGAIATFEKASTEITDDTIKNWVIASLPELRLHLEHAMACQKIAERK